MTFPLNIFFQELSRTTLASLALTNEILGNYNDIMHVQLSHLVLQFNEGMVKIDQKEKDTKIP